MEEFKHNYWAQRFEKCNCLKEIELTAYEHLEDAKTHVKLVEDFYADRAGLAAETILDVSKKAVKLLEEYHNTKVTGHARYYILTTTFADAIEFIYETTRKEFKEAIEVSKKNEDSIIANVTKIIYNKEKK